MALLIIWEVADGMPFPSRKAGGLYNTLMSLTHHLTTQVHIDDELQE
jgi:hypothetical protein